MTWQQWKALARRLKRQATALAFAARDRRTPWYAKALAVAVVAYALSPIDLIPDFIPVLGLLDDLILLPLGVALVVRLIPPAVWADCLARADEGEATSGRAGRVAAFLIVACWVLVLAAGTAWAARWFLKK